MLRSPAPDPIAARSPVSVPVPANSPKGRSTRSTWYGPTGFPAHLLPSPRRLKNQKKKKRIHILCRSVGFKWVSGWSLALGSSYNRWGLAGQRFHLIWFWYSMHRYSKYSKNVLSGLCPCVVMGVCACVYGRECVLLLSFGAADAAVAPLCWQLIIILFIKAKVCIDLGWDCLVYNTIRYYRHASIINVCKATFFKILNTFAELETKTFPVQSLTAIFHRMGMEFATSVNRILISLIIRIISNGEHWECPPEQVFQKIYICH